MGIRAILEYSYRPSIQAITTQPFLSSLKQVLLKTRAAPAVSWKRTQLPAYAWILLPALALNGRVKNTSALSMYPYIYIYTYVHAYIHTHISASGRASRKLIRARVRGPLSSRPPRARFDLETIDCRGIFSAKSQFALCALASARICASLFLHYTLPLDSSSTAILTRRLSFRLCGSKRRVCLVMKENGLTVWNIFSLSRRDSRVKIEVLGSRLFCELARDCV